MVSVPDRLVSVNKTLLAMQCYCCFSSSSDAGSDNEYAKQNKKGLRCDLHLLAWKGSSPVKAAWKATGTGAQLRRIRGITTTRLRGPGLALVDFRDTFPNQSTHGKSGPCKTASSSRDSSPPRVCLPLPRHQRSRQFSKDLREY